MSDAINHPQHYTSDPSGVECITITRHRNFNVGNAIKYLWRAGLKGFHHVDGTVLETSTAQDLNKALWYIADEIVRLGCAVTCRHAAIAQAIEAQQVQAITEAVRARLNTALVAIFGAEADRIQISHIDHLCTTLTPHHVEQLLRAVGGPWAAILDRIAERRASAAAAKDPGEDVRMKADQAKA